MRKKIGFLFGAGAELAYGMPSGGKFALDIFRHDPAEAKNKFKDIREKLDASYASAWLPSDYKDRIVGAFGKSVFESIITDTIEHRREDIIKALNDFDTIAQEAIQAMNSEINSIDKNAVDKSIEEITGKSVDKISMAQQIEYTDEFTKGNYLFKSHYFSALLITYSQINCKKTEDRTAIRKVLISILQLHLGALSKKLSMEINEKPFKKLEGVGAIDIFEDLGEFIQLNYRSTGLSGLEYLLDSKQTDTSSSEGILALFSQKILETVFSKFLDYKTLIDSTWHYLYYPKVEWAKFCKISIFLFTVQNYITKQYKPNSTEGYYDDLKRAIDTSLFTVSTIATTNYTALIKSKLGNHIQYLNGSTEQYYDPYLNKIINEPNDNALNLHFYVPLIFTQSGTKPLTCIEMSKKYVDVYKRYEESDIICAIGFGFNPDDDHINSMIRTLIEKGKTLVVFEINKGKTEQEKAKELSEKLKLQTCENIKVIYIDPDTRQNCNNKPWTALLSEC